MSGVWALVSKKFAEKGGHVRVVAVFGAASDKISKQAKENAQKLGKWLGVYNKHLIFGAGDCGVMGEVHKGYSKGQPVTRAFGSTTYYLDIMEPTVRDAHIVSTHNMSNRKEIYWLADTMIIMLGGVGTMDELFEFMTMKRLKRWTGKIYILTGSKQAKLLKALFDNMVIEKTLPKWEDLVEFVTLQQLLDKVEE